MTYNGEIEDADGIFNIIEYTGTKLKLEWAQADYTWDRWSGGVFIFTR